MPSTTLGTPLRCSCIVLLSTIHGSICSFWRNLSGHFIRFVCNHSLCTGSTVVGQCMEQLPNGYALITGILPFTLRARFVHVKSLLQFYRRTEQTTAMDGGSVDFAGASHRPDSLTDFRKTWLQNSAFL